MSDGIRCVSRAVCVWVLFLPSLLLGEGEEKTAAETPKEKTWNASGSMGLTLSSGNTEQVLGSANLAADKAWDPWQIVAKVDGEYGETDQETSSEKAKGSMQWNLKLNERFYWLLLSELERDAVADVEYRLKVSPGMGYKVVHTEHSTLNIEVGPGYMREKLGDGTEQDAVTLRASERYELTLQEGVKIWQSVEMAPEVEDFEAYLLNAEVGVESAVSKKLGLRFVIKDSYDSEPAEGKEENDLSLTSSLLWKF